MGLNKMHFVEQLAQKIKTNEAIAERAQRDAEEAARSMATEAEKKEDGRAAIEFGILAKGQASRSAKAQDELKQLAAFTRAGLKDFRRNEPVGLGAIVDITIENNKGSHERTFILLPVGAGTELVGPDGDGFISVITPASPVGKSLLGRKPGESFEITIKDESHEWTVVEVS